MKHPHVSYKSFYDSPDTHKQKHATLYPGQVLTPQFSNQTGVKKVCRKTQFWQKSCILPGLKRCLHKSSALSKKTGIYGVVCLRRRQQQAATCWDLIPCSVYDETTLPWKLKIVDLVRYIEPDSFSS